MPTMNSSGKLCLILLALIEFSVNASSGDIDHIFQFSRDILNHETFAKLCRQALQSSEFKTCHQESGCVKSDSPGPWILENLHDNELEDDSKLLELLKTNFPWIESKSVVQEERNLTFDRDGSVYIQFNEFDAIGVCLHHGHLFGPLVQRHDGVLLIQEKAEDEKFIPKWVFTLDSGIWYDENGGVFIIPKNPNCSAVDLSHGFKNLREANVRQVLTQSGFPVPELESRPNHKLSLDIPSHILDEEDYDEHIILEALIALNCSRKHWKPFQSIVDHKKYKVASRNPVRQLSSYWDSVLGNDPECSEHASIWWASPDLFRKTTLACFPGSGSKWLMELIQFATGIGTGVNPGKTPLLIDKTHHDSNARINLARWTNTLRQPDWHFRMRRLQMSDGKAILLIRNPYEAIVSWWHHIMKGNSRLEEADPDKLRATLSNASFCSFAKSEVRMWKTLILDWITFIPNVLIVHYEKMKLDYVQEITNILRFMKFPFPKERERCLKKYPIDRFKRKNSLNVTKDLFCSQAVNLIDRAIFEVNEALKELHYDSLPMELYSNVLEPSASTSLEEITNFFQDVQKVQGFAKLCKTSLEKDQQSCFPQEGCNAKGASRYLIQEEFHPLDSQVRLLNFLKYEFTWVQKRKRVLKVRGSGLRMWHGYVFVTFPDEELLGVCLHHHHLFGPLMQRFNDKVILHKNAQEKDNPDVLRWRLEQDIGIFHDGMGNTAFFALDPKCTPALVLGNSVIQRSFESMELIDSNGMKVLKLDGETKVGDKSFPLPTHMIQDEDFNENKQMIVESLFKLQCTQAKQTKFQPIKDEEKYKQSKRNPITEKSSYWNEILGDDPECSNTVIIWWPSPDVFRKTALVCFPGSGSKWLVELLQFATGVGTGVNRGKEMRLLDKTHHDSIENINEARWYSTLRRPKWKDRLESLSMGQGRGILLVRDPYESIISWWNHILSGDPLYGESDPHLLEASLKQEKFCDFAVAEIRMWKILILDWLSVSHDLLIVHFEKMKMDYVGEVQKILDFMNLPFDKSRQRCMEKYPSNRFKRKKAVQVAKTLFCPEAIALIDEAINEVNQALKRYHFEPLPLHLYKSHKDHEEC